MRLGIDFGTTRTVVAAVAEGRYPVATFQTDDGFCPWIPTMAAFDGQGWVYGEDAAARLRRADGRGVRSLKRVLGRLGAKAPLVGLPGPTVTGLELATGFLRHH